MLIIISLNFVFNGCCLCFALFLLYNSENFYYKARKRVRIHPWVTMLLFSPGKHYLCLRWGNTRAAKQWLAYLFYFQWQPQSVGATDEGPTLKVGRKKAVQLTTSPRGAKRGLWGEGGRHHTAIVFPELFELSEKFRMNTHRLLRNKTANNQQ